VHYRTEHLKLRPYECYCGAKFGHKHLLQRHKSVVHNADDIESVENGDVTMDAAGSNLHADDEESAEDSGVVVADAEYVNTSDTNTGLDAQYDNDINMATQNTDFAKLLTGFDFKNQSNNRPLECYFGGCHSRFYRIYDLERHISSCHHQGFDV
jgi:hypothetical protein